MSQVPSNRAWLTSDKDDHVSQQHCSRESMSTSEAAHHPAVSQAEVLALMCGLGPGDRRSELERLLDYLTVVIENSESQSRGHARAWSLGRLISHLPTRARLIFARHFDPQRLADFAADPDQAPRRRLTAMRVLEQGACEFVALRSGNIAVSLAKVTYLVIAKQLHNESFAQAAESLQLFTGLGPSQSATLIQQTMDG